MTDAVFKKIVFTWFLLHKPETTTNMYALCMVSSLKRVGLDSMQVKTFIPDLSPQAISTLIGNSRHFCITNFKITFDAALHLDFFVAQS